jgi:hypothetical protein
MTQEQFLIAVYELATGIVNAITALLQELGPYVGPILDFIADLLSAADYVLYWVEFGVCLAAGE